MLINRALCLSATLFICIPSAIGSIPPLNRHDDHNTGDFDSDILEAIRAYDQGEPFRAANMHRETLAEAAENVKRLIRDVPYGSIATVFPHTTSKNNAKTDNQYASSDSFYMDSLDSGPSTGWKTPGAPFAMLEYHAPCFPLPSLTFLLLPVSLSVRNLLASKTRKVSYMIREESVSGSNKLVGGINQKVMKGRKNRGMMDHARVSLIGVSFASHICDSLLIDVRCTLLTSISTHHPIPPPHLTNHRT